MLTCIIFKLVAALMTDYEASCMEDQQLTKPEINVQYFSQIRSECVVIIDWIRLEIQCKTDSEEFLTSCSKCRVLTNSHTAAAAAAVDKVHRLHICGQIQHTLYNTCP